MRERDPPHHEHERPRFRPDLPSELADFLRDLPYACLLQPADRGTAFVVKAPGDDIDGARGTVPVRLRHDLYDHPAAPVIRTLRIVHDRPQAPLAFETFTNVAEPDQRADFAALGTQSSIQLLFYDAALRHRLTKLIGNRRPDAVAMVLARADALLHQSPPGQFDFEAAKRAIVRRTTL